MNPRKGKFAAGVRPARNFSSHRLSLISIHLPAASLFPPSFPRHSVRETEFYQSQSSVNIMQTSDGTSFIDNHLRSVFLLAGEPAVYLYNISKVRVYVYVIQEKYARACVTSV